nr:protein chromatin remodeling 4-like isoform X1 [Tanacetum cinerariifolium]
MIWMLVIIAIHLLKHNNIVDIEGDTSTWIEAKKPVGPLKKLEEECGPGVECQPISMDQYLKMGMNDNKWEDILRWGTKQLFNGSSTQAGKDVIENNDNKGEEIVGFRKKEDNSGNVAEENEWDRILESGRSSLGRGKRQRKVVSYREAYAPKPMDTPETTKHVWTKGLSSNERHLKLSILNR